MRVTNLYSEAHDLPSVGDDFVSSCVDDWAKNPSRDPRRLIRLAIHRLDYRRELARAAIEPAADLSSIHGVGPTQGGMMKPQDADNEFDRLVRAVPDLSGREPGKFRDLKSWVGELLQMSSDRVSVKYLGTPNNLKNRQSSQSRWYGCVYRAAPLGNDQRRPQLEMVGRQPR